MASVTQELVSKVAALLGGSPWLSGTTVIGPAFLPDSPDKAICVQTYLALPAVRGMGHGTTGHHLDEFRFRVYCRDTTHELASTLAFQLHALLESTGPFTIESHNYAHIAAQGLPIVWSPDGEDSTFRDQQDRVVFYCDYEAARYP